MSAFLSLLPVLGPALLGAWFVLAKPADQSRRTWAARVALGAFAVMAIGGLLVFFSPWFQENNSSNTRDPAGVAAVEPYFFAVWTTLIVLLCFGVGGWIAGLARTNIPKFIVASVAVFVFLPGFLFISTLVFGCFFAGACL